MSQVGAVAVFAMLVNTSLGVGFLTVPWIFVQIGNTISIVVLISITLITLAVSLMIVEVSSRAEFVLQSEENGVPAPKLSMSLAFKRKPETEIPLISASEANIKIKPTLTDRRKFELGELCNIYLGDTGMHLYMLCMVIGSYGLFCSFTILFASSFTSNVPIFNLETCDISNVEEFWSPCRFKYWFWMCLYIVLMICLTIAGLENQKTFQIFFTIARILILSLMIGTSIYSVAANVPLNSNLEHHDQDPFSLHILFLCIPMIKFTLGFQTVIPSALQQMKNKKENAKLVIILASAVCTISVMAIGLTTGSALKGYRVPTLSTLAWRGYDAGISPRPIWTYAVEYIIVIFPALNVLTSCPPSSIASVETLKAYLKSQFNINSKKCILILILWAPVLLVCLIFYNLGKCTSATALTSYFTVYISVCLMHLISRKYVPDKSPFEGWHSSSFLAWSIFCYVSLLLVVNTGYLIFT